jgi:hypothetical protein
VEPGEIEEVLRGCEGAEDAVVVASKTSAGSIALVGYLKSGAAAEDGERLLARARTALADKLPAHMRPAQLVVLDSFPLTLNGKIDHARLPAPRPASAPPSAAAAEGLERTLVQIFRRVLGVEEIGLDANFFDLGATSLKLIAAHAAIEDVCGGVEVIALFEHPNVRELALHLRRRADSSAGDEARNRGQQQREALRRSRRAKAPQ